MRGTRWLILAAMAAILAGVGLTWRWQRSALEQQAPAKPKALPLDLNSSAEDWTWRQSMPGEGRPAVEIRAHRVAQSKDNSRVQLENVELRLYKRDGGEFDRVRSPKAQFSPLDKSLYSDGDVEIALGMPAEGQPKRNLVGIKATGVMFDSTTGKATTERAADFTFENGHGRSVGASYDPITRELHMASQVELHWKAPKPGAKPMKLEAGELRYKEAESKVWLLQWARLTRENTLLESGPAVVTLEEGAIRYLEGQKARGTERYPNRQVEYSADEMWVRFGEDGEAEEANGQGNARLVSTSATSVNTVTAGVVRMEFGREDGAAALSKALAAGGGVLESKPLAAAGRPLRETRVLRSDTFEMRMRPGGREVEAVDTHARGTLEFLPNRPADRRRTLEGERIWMTYGERNQLRTFRSVSVATRTEPAEEERKRRRAPALTRSKNLLAEFDPKTGQMSRMEQWDDFAYEEGDRRARGVKAILEQAENVLLLEGAARVWDATGSTSADRIRLDQRSGEFFASGHVNSSRVPERRKSASEMLSGDQPLQAVAQGMTAKNNNRLIHYEGGVVLWQGANRIEADRVDIDREKRTLVAAGKVRTQFVEEADTATRRRAGAATNPPAPNAAPVFTVVQAANLVYTERDRLAHYTGGVLLVRPGLRMKGARLRAYLAAQGAESRIDKAYADGRVEIDQAAAGRTRRGTGEHAEYYATEQKIVLRGGEPLLVDSKGGSARGTQLTYYANDDRLLVIGAPGQPATSRIRRK